MTEKLISRDRELLTLKDGLKNVRSGKGGIFVLTGEAGFGKTYLIDKFLDLCKDKDEGALHLYVEAQAPIGKFNVSNIRPLYPFAKLAEMLLENKHVSANQKFARNLGLTALSIVPLVGDVFYAVKEVGRDWRQFKRDKSSAEIGNVSIAAADYYDLICSYADKAPLVLCLDDMHWADAQTVELLNLFAASIDNIPLMLVLGVREQVVETQALPMYSFIGKHKNKTKNLDFLELEIFDQNDISRLSAQYFENYVPNDEFEEWIDEHSYGVPGVVAEYLKYFSQYPPFGPDGRLATNFKGNEFLPATVQSLFSQHLEKLTEDDKHILSVCSTEGREFTATILAELLKTDVLDTIKKLKSLQNRTNIVKSIGAQKRYGVKTTVYKFTQAFYQSYFENLLEYEEYVALHGEIAQYLKEKYNNSKLDDVKKSIVPYLAAHSIEAGDEGTAQDMMLETAKMAKEYGSDEILKQAYSNFMQYSDNPEVAADANADNRHKEFLEMMKDAINTADIMPEKTTGERDQIAAEDVINFESVRLAVVNNYHLKNYEVAAQKAENYLESKEYLPAIEEAQLLALAAKARIELGDFKTANSELAKALKIFEKRQEPQAEHFVLNTCAVLNAEQGNYNKAFFYLEEAAKKAVGLPPELRLITVSNIALILKKMQPAKSQKYYESAVKLCEVLAYKRFANDLEQVW